MVPLVPQFGACILYLNHLSLLFVPAGEGGTSQNKGKSSALSLEKAGGKQKQLERKKETEQKGEERHSASRNSDCQAEDNQTG